MAIAFETSPHGYFRARMPTLRNRDTAVICKSRYHRPMTLRAAATWLFGVFAGVFVTALVLPLISANVRKLASERGWDNGLVRLWDALPEKFRDDLRWVHLLGLWWLWSILGLSGGVVLALWLIPQIVGLTQPTDDTRSRLEEARRTVSTPTEQNSDLRHQCRMKKLKLRV
jgi:hypothetical protein